MCATRISVFIMERIRTYIPDNGEVMSGKSLAMSEKNGQKTYHIALKQKRDREVFGASAWEDPYSRAIFGGNSPEKFVDTLKALGFELPKSLQGDVTKKALEDFINKNPQWEPKLLDEKKAEGYVPLRISILYSLNGRENASVFSRQGITQYLTPATRLGECLHEDLGIYGIKNPLFSTSADAGTALYSSMQLYPASAPYNCCDESVAAWLSENKPANAIQQQQSNVVTVQQQIQ